MRGIHEFYDQQRHINHFSSTCKLIWFTRNLASGITISGINKASVRIVLPEWHDVHDDTALIDNHGDKTMFIFIESAFVEICLFAGVHFPISRAVVLS